MQRGDVIPPDFLEFDTGLDPAFGTIWVSLITDSVYMFSS